MLLRSQEINPNKSLDAYNVSTSLSAVRSRLEWLKTNKAEKNDINNMSKLLAFNFHPECKHMQK